LAEDSKHIDYLITRFLAGEASLEERLQLEQWMNASEANKKYFADNRFIHDRAIASNRLVRVNVDKAWESLHGQMKIGHKELNMPAGKAIPFRLPVWLRVAAVFLLLLGLSYWFYLNYSLSSNHGLKVISIISNESIVSRKIPDNSSVVLNRRSKIIYSSTFGTKNRELALSGEAYFKVRHSVDTPFIVRTENVLIKDIGTTFNIKSYKESKTIEVFVETGEIQFFTYSNPGIRLVKGETGIYDKSSGHFYKTGKIEVNVLSYKTKVFVFQNTSLNDAVRQLNATYPVSIRINNNRLMNCKITVTFDNEDIGTIANIIGETMGLQVIKLPDGYLLEGKSCLNSK
jgi:transmembrane sensor